MDDFEIEFEKHQRETRKMFEEAERIEQLEKEVERLEKLVAQKNERLEEADAEIEAWKDASGLECGGDPDNVTPEACRKYWKEFERKNTSPTLYWSHIDGGWDLLECMPFHPQQPSLHVVRMPGKDLGAQVLITCHEWDDDDNGVITIADVIVPFRDSLYECSICGGTGLDSNSNDECPWCQGNKKTAMDEAREIACALYWSWLRSPNGGGKAE